MNEKVRMSIFLVVFLSVYFLIHYFVINSYLTYFSIGGTLLLYTLTFLLTISYPLAMLIEKKSENTFGRMFYVLCSVWMGFLFISLFVILLTKLVGLFSAMSLQMEGMIVLSVSLVVSIYALINAATLRVKKIELVNESIKNDMRIVQLSDIHLGSINRTKYLQRIVDKTNAQNPDVVVITGDLVDGSAPISEHMVDYVNKIKAPIYYIIGNHEIYEGLDTIMPILSKTKMKILRDEVASHKLVDFVGIDYREGNSFVNKIIGKYKAKTSKPRILLYHAPSLTHHGQIFPFTLLVRIAFPYVRGLHASNNKKHFAYVSPGTGTWGPPMRLGSSCEITVINVKRKAL
jgi:uncharacterized protein